MSATNTGASGNVLKLRVVSPDFVTPRMSAFRHMLSLLCLLGAMGLPAQQAEYASGQLIVQLRQGIDGARWAEKQPHVVAWRRLSPTLNTWLVQADESSSAPLFSEKHFTRDPAVNSVQLNHRLSLRRRPNDPRYGQQWQLRNTGQTGRRGADYNLEAAWETTTGGVTVNGDTIVIASIDNGVDLDHEDLVGNLWVNRDEVPGNGLDDDRNGYIDDVLGWNTALENNDVEGGGGDHGTSVMGQIAATGNNGVGVTGINWDARVMTITNDFDPLESEVIQAYGYALEARKRYDATDGREGAYVVATNASWGRDRAFPSQSPIWCAMYDSLGKYGIINVAAVPNSDVDVDVVGDLPSLCTSDYLIVVTNLDAEDRRVKNAARGMTSVDLAAYGEGVYTTTQRNGYGPVYGTSFAAPAVTGALGLLYSAPCTSFGELLRGDPAAAALYIKERLYGGVRPLPSLTGITSTGGVLDVGAAMDGLMDDCGGCPPPTSLTAEGVGEDLQLRWNAIATTGTVTLRYRRAGTQAWTEVANVHSPYTLTDLPACTDYDLQLRAECGDDSSVTELLTVETPGCCRLPGDFRLQALPGGRLSATWAAVPSAESYTLRYRSGGVSWTEITTADPAAVIDELRNCRDYIFELRTNCRGSRTDFGRRRQVTTLGCGVCLDTDYCTPTGYGNEQEWIAGVELSGIFANLSERGRGGYENFGDLTEAAMVPGGVYPLTITPAFRGGGFTEDYHVYIDWDQDGQWSEAELVVESMNSGGKEARTTVTVPRDAVEGLTRMRVIMQFSAVSQEACAMGAPQVYGGEVEDYCVDISPARGCPPPDSVIATYDEATDETRLRWGASAAPGGSYLLRYRERTAAEYRELRVDGVAATVGGTNLCSSYELQIASVCDGRVGEFRTVYLGDDCVGNDAYELSDTEWAIAPNPATDFARVSWVAEVSVAELTVFAADGRRLLVATPEISATERQLPIAELPAGVYLVRLRTHDGRRGVRRLLVR